MKSTNGMFKKLDVNAVKIVVGFYTVSELIHLVRSAYLKNMGIAYVDLPWNHLIGFYFLMDWVIFIALMLWVSIFVKYSLVKNMGWNQLIPIHFIGSLMVSIIIKLPINISYDMIYHPGFTLSFGYIKHRLLEMLAIIDLNFVNYFAIVSLLYLYFYLERQKSFKVRESKLNQLATDSKLRALQYQIRPHFLFNALNSISTLTENLKARDSISDLADLLKNYLELEDKQFIRVRDEIHLLKKYLKIIRLRYGGRINVRFEIEIQTLEEWIPVLLLQPLVENAIKHGLSNKSHLEILIKMTKESDEIQIIVQNDGKPIDFSQLIHNNGMGLSNIQSRLRLLFGKTHKFSMLNAKNGKVEFKMVLPTFRRTKPGNFPAIEVHH